MSDVYQKAKSSSDIVQGRSTIFMPNNSYQLSLGDRSVKTNDIAASGGGGKYDTRWDDVRYYSGDNAS